MRLALALWFGVSVGMLGASAARSLEITNVSHAPESFEPGGQRGVEIRFQLSERAPVEILFYDAQQVLRGSVRTRVPLGAGDHTVRWNGLDPKGSPLPAEAYRYVVRAGPDPSGETAVWDLEDPSARQAPKTMEALWDAQAGRVRYELARPARVVLRVGLEAEGPLLATVVNWSVRATGSHEERWSGRDASGLLDLRSHPKLKLTLLAYPLPRNTVLIDGPPIQGPVLERAGPAGPGRDVSTVGTARPETRGDCTLNLRVLDGTSGADQRPLVGRGEVRIQVDVPEAERDRILSERFEVGFFVDGVLVFENEVGFLPMTWTWNAHGANPGPHTLTANIWGFRGSMGAASIVMVTAEGETKMGD